VSKPDIETVSSRVAYSNKWLRVREDVIRRRDGGEGLYAVVEKPDFVVVAPWHDGRLHLVEQFRYPVQSRQWEFPQGAWDDPNAAWVDVARGELEEETGQRAGGMVEIGQIHPLYGTASQSYRLFLATDLTAGPQRLEESEQDLITRAFPLAEVERMMLDGTIRDGVTIASFGLLRLRRLL